MRHHSLPELHADIARRLRPVIPRMPQEEFDARVARMAHIAWKYARMDPQRPTPPQASPAQR